jgi:hypothetical protein
MDQPGISLLMGLFEKSDCVVFHSFYDRAPITPKKSGEFLTSFLELIYFRRNSDPSVFFAFSRRFHAERAAAF